MESATTRGYIQLASYFLISILTVVVILLVIQNRKLKSSLSSGGASGIGSLEAGARLVPTRMMTLGGGSVTLAYDQPDKKYLLFVFSTTCPHCEKTIGFWNSLREENRDENFNIIGISLGGLGPTREYVTSKGLNFFVAAAADSSFRQTYKIGGVPQTIIVGSDGTVRNIWVGELSDTKKAEVVKELGE